ncbi:MAG: hypothetical protein JWR85_1441 [Marmoricola sp.]|nr:hypothetical protein [Marmoricola sp.]
MALAVPALVVALAAGVLALLMLAGFVFMVVAERTRWIALGILAGVAILFILAAGACVVLIVALNNSLN